LAHLLDGQRALASNVESLAVDQSTEDGSPQLLDAQPVSANGVESLAVDQPAEDGLAQPLDAQPASANDAQGAMASARLIAESYADKGGEVIDVFSAFVGLVSSMDKPLALRCLEVTDRWIEVNLKSSLNNDKSAASSMTHAAVAPQQGRLVHQRPSFARISAVRLKAPYVGPRPTKSLPGKLGSKWKRRSAAHGPETPMLNSGKTYRP
jgi:hypothetical protein